MAIDLLREDFNVHLLTADVVGNVFRSDGQHVLPWQLLPRDQKVPGAGACRGIPPQTDGVTSLHPRQHGSCHLVGAGANVDRLSGSISGTVEPYTYDGRLAGDHKALVLAI